MLRYFRQHGDRLLSSSEPAAEADGPVWIDMLEPTREEEVAVETLLALSVPTRAEMQEIEVSSRLYVEDGATYMTITALAHLSEGEPQKTPVTFILKGRTLVTVRYAESKPFQTFTAQCQRPAGWGQSDGEVIMLGILEAIVDRTADALEQISDAVDQISRGVFFNREKAERKTRDLQGVIEQIGHKGDTLSLIQESLMTLRRVAAYLTAMEAEGAKRPREIRQRIKLVDRDTASLRDHAGFLSDKIAFLLDATLGLINLEQSKIIKIFSVVAVIFLPPTLVASIYGMNFQFMPELGWPFGYPLALLLMIASAILPYLFFKRRKWL